VFGGNTRIAQRSVLLPALCKDFRIQNIPIPHITPHIALQRIKRPRFYPCRRALANDSFRRINSLECRMMHVMAKLLALFSGMLTRFPHIVRLLRLRRKNLLSYPFFAQQALLHLGYPHFASVFATLKSLTRHQLQTLMLKLLFVAGSPCSIEFSQFARHSSNPLIPFDGLYCVRKTAKPFVTLCTCTFNFFNFRNFCNFVASRP
jgi:hypothetical protein